MKTLLRGGYVVSGRGCRRADVLRLYAQVAAQLPAPLNPRPERPNWRPAA